MKTRWDGWVCAVIAVSLMSLSEWLRQKGVLRMSRGFKIPAVTSERVREVRERTGYGMHEASVLLRQDDLQTAIEKARDVEDLRVCLLGLLSLVRRR